MNHPGVFIALEGSDGSGKTTQIKLLEKKLKKAGYSVKVFAFPQYKRASSHFVRQYLAGGYGTAASISPYAAAIFYAMDRFEAAEEIRQALAKGRIVIADRFTGSNMAHQGSKFTKAAEKRGFFLWVENLEFEMLGIPRPDKNIYLHLDPAVSKRRITSRSKQTRTDLDEHEKDDLHLNETTKTYELMSQLFSKDFIKIDCEVHEPAKISAKIWQIVKPLLPPNRS